MIGDHVTYSTFVFASAALGVCLRVCAGVCLCDAVFPVSGDEQVFVSDQVFVFVACRFVEPVRSLWVLLSSPLVLLTTHPQRLFVSVRIVAEPRQTTRYMTTLKTNLLKQTHHRDAQRFLGAIQRNWGISREAIAEEGVYFSHETCTHATPTASCAFNEVSALRQCFGEELLARLVIINTKVCRGRWCLPVVVDVVVGVVDGGGGRSRCVAAAAAVVSFFFPAQH